jgi:hypothetical protein
MTLWKIRMYMGLKDCKINIGMHHLIIIYDIAGKSVVVVLVAFTPDHGSKPQ